MDSPAIPLIESMKPAIQTNAFRNMQGSLPILTKLASGGGRGSLKSKVIATGNGYGSHCGSTLVWRGRLDYACL
jgi:hypothetical protein